MLLNYTFCGLILIFLTSACTHDPLHVDASGRAVKLDFERLDSLLIHTPETKLAEVLEKKDLATRELLEYQLGTCLGVGPLSDTGTARRIRLFTEDPYIKRVHAHIEKQFGTLNAQKNEIHSGFQHLKYHFPKLALPEKVVFMNSLFTSSVFCTKKEIGIGLERYLGEKTDVIQELPSELVYQWVKEGMRPEYLTRDVLTAFIMTHLVPEDNQNVAAAMIRWGKIIYLTEAAFPKKEKHLILRYTKEDFKWAEDNEYAFWKYLVDEKLLFSINERDMQNFLNEAPFTIGLPEKGPDRLGQFLGWRMIHSYMREFPKTPLEELIKLSFTEILTQYEAR